MDHYLCFDSKGDATLFRAIQSFLFDFGGQWEVSPGYQDLCLSFPVICFEPKSKTIYHSTRFAANDPEIYEFVGDFSKFIRK